MQIGASMCRNPYEKSLPAEAMIDADYADDLELLGYTPVKPESSLHSLEQTAENIGLYVNSDKIEVMF